MDVIWVRYGIGRFNVKTLSFCQHFFPFNLIIDRDLCGLVIEGLVGSFCLGEEVREELLGAGLALWPAP